MRKTIALLGFILAICIVSNALDVKNLNGSFDVLKLDENGNALYNETFEFTPSNEKIYRDSIAVYNLRGEEVRDFKNVRFYETNSRYYVTVTTQDSNVSNVYRVTEEHDFYITLENIHDSKDVMVISYNKSYNDYDYEEYYQSLVDVSGEDLYYDLYHFITNHKDLGYKPAKVEMFGKIDNDENGDIHCVYTNLVVHSKYPKNEVMNCEHTWPQSKFGSQGNTMRGDLHHLFSTDSKANSRRSNYDFGEPTSVKWEQDGSVLGKDDSGSYVFSPKDSHKGDAARAIFYMAVRYRMDVNEKMEKVLRKWNELDPVDEVEMQRNNMIETYQHNRNPFVDHPEFVNRIENF